MIAALIIALGLSALAVGFVLGGFVATRRDDRQHAPDDHAQWLGADAGFSNHGRGI